MRNLTQITDPLGNKTKLAYWENQSLKSLTDAAGNTTSWNVDIQNRVTGKTYANGKGDTYAYENTTSRLKSLTDALGQIKQYGYAKDNALTNITYLNAVNATPNVSFTLDPYFRRIASMTDGSGTTNYSYYAPGAQGALQLQTEATPFTNGTIGYQYDLLSRLSARTVDSSTETFTYDKISRLTQHGTALGTFNLTYLGQTGQLTSQQISTGTVGTTRVYDTNVNDRRLKSIINSGASRSFNFTTTPENLITQIQETAPGGSAWAPQNWNYIYDPAYRLTQGQSSSGADYQYTLDPADNILSQQTPSGNRSASYNDLNEITTFNGSSFVYDLNGNLLDDGTHTYAWDAQNRLLSVTSKANPAQKASFRYDGRDRRIAIDTTNGMTSETRYLWCGEQLCQARTSTDTVSRRYYPEGEYLPLGGTSLYYSQDQLGSVRDVLATQNGSRVASFDYDAQGNPTQSYGRISTDFRYGGLFYDQQDGLYLAEHRVYSPLTVAWLSRDPGGETGGINLYAYVGNDPMNRIDPSGLRWIIVTIWHGDLPNSVGHVVASELGGDIILSQFPRPLKGLTGPNVTLSMANTESSEGVPADNVFLVYLPNDYDFDVSAATSRNAPLWAAINFGSAYSTNCVYSVTRALEAGGLPVYVPVLPLQLAAQLNSLADNDQDQPWTVLPVTPSIIWPEMRRSPVVEIPRE